MSNISQRMPFGNLGTQDQNSFPDPFNDVASLSMPDTMKNALHWCLPPGTLIELGDGTLKPIEDIIANDRVLTRGGTVEKVVQCSSRPVDEEIVRLEIAGFGKRLPLRLTANHNVWRIKTAKLKPGKVTSRLKIENAEKVPSAEVRKGDYFVTPLPRRDWKCPASHPAEWPPGQARFSGYIAGMYAAEGCAFRDPSGTLLAARFTMGRDDEFIGVAERLRGLLENEIGKKVTVYTPPSRQDIRLITAHDVELPGWLAEHVPGLAGTKSLCPSIFGYTDEFILQFLGGYLDGDGHVSNSRGRFSGMSVTSISQVLLRQVQRLAYCVGMTPSLSSVNNTKGYSATSDGSKSNAYVLSFDKVDSNRLVGYSVKATKASHEFADFVCSTTKSAKTIIRDGYVYHRVTAALREHYIGNVHNFEVENDHSYIANGVICANCEYIYMLFGTYRMAMERIISYFLTDVEIGGDEVSDDEKDKYEDFLKNTLDIYTFLQSMCRDRMCYGNAFCSVIVPFKRFLMSPKTGDMYPLKEVYKNPKFNFSWSNFEFVATCPKSGWRGAFKVIDKPDDEEKKIKLKRWSPHEIELLHDHYTGDVDYLWRIPEDYKKQVKDGNLFHLERVSVQVLKAIKHNQLFRFHQDVIYHMKEPTLAGIRNRGWGIPRIISNFRQIYYVQVLRRFNEAIALDYVIPFRLITPEPSAGGSVGGVNSADPLSMFHGGDFKSAVTAMIRKRRRDPAAWNVLPYPVQYNILGGDAQKLAPRDLLDQGTEQLLNDAGTPVELYKGSLQIQSAPVALRLFEATWHHLVHDTNDCLSWLVRQISQIMSWEVVEAQLKRVVIADDMEKQMAALQLMMGQQLSGKSGLGAMGYDWDTEQKRMAEEARKQQEIQSRMQEEMETAGFAQQMAKGQGGPGGGPGGAPGGGGAAGGAGAGGDPSGGAGGAGAGGAGALPGMGDPTPVSSYIQSMGPDTPVTPNDLQATAKQLASELLGKPEGVKDSELRKLKQYNEVLHSIVKAEMDGFRQDAKTQGGAQMMQQQFPQGQAG